jgi:formyl-CoA transferase
VIGVEHATLGDIELPGPTLRFFAQDGVEQTKTTHLAPPTLDQHGAALRDEFGAKR